MPTKHMNTYKKVLIIISHKINANWNQNEMPYTHTLETAKTKKTNNIKCWHQLKLSYIAVGYIKWYKQFGKMLTISYKIKHIPTRWPRNSTSIHLPQENENICSQKVFGKNVHNIHNIQKLEKAQASINSRMIDRLSNKKKYWYKQHGLISKTLRCVKDLYQRLHTIWCHFYDNQLGKMNLQILYVYNHVYCK